MNIRIKKLNESAILPSYQSTDAAGADLYACLETPVIIPHGQVVMIPTGLSIEIPTGYEMQIRARSGLASKGLIIPNAPGTIDADYRGEIKILLLNLSGLEMEITPKMRIAQAIISPIFQVTFEITDELSNTERGTGGFGSTGTHQ